LELTSGEHMTTIRSFIMPPKKTTMAGFVLTPVDPNQCESTLLREEQN
jgi:hypothetical protein